MTSTRTRTRTRAAAVAVTALACLATLSGCSSEPTYDAEELAAKVVAEQEKVTPDLSVTDGTCEEDVPLEEGEVISCSVTIDGVEAPYDVTVESLEEEQANYQIRPAQAIISHEQVVDALQAELETRDIIGAEIDCGADAVRVADPGDTFTCSMSLGGQTREATISVEDLDGKIRYEF